MPATHVTINLWEPDSFSFIGRVYDKWLQFMVHRRHLKFSLNKSVSIAFAQFIEACGWRSFAIYVERGKRWTSLTTTRIYSGIRNTN